MMIEPHNWRYIRFKADMVYSGKLEEGDPVAPSKDEIQKVYEKIEGMIKQHEQETEEIIARLELEPEMSKSIRKERIKGIKAERNQKMLLLQEECQQMLTQLEI